MWSCPVKQIHSFQVANFTLCHQEQIFHKDIYIAEHILFSSLTICKH
jgi:hypothetical protein